MAEKTIISKENGKVIVLGSGSVRGYYLIGSIFALHINNSLKDHSEYYGISVGSIFATLLCLNVSLADIIHEAMKFNFFEGWDQLIMNFNFLDLFTGTKKTIGFIDPKKIKERLEYWMRIKYKKVLTFQELFILTGKSLTVVVTDRSNPENPHAIYRNHINCPEYSVSQAVIESCSIPVIFETNNYIDGVFSDPFPVEQLTGKIGLAFILHEEFKRSGDNSLKEMLIDIYSSLMIPIKIMLRRKIEQCPEGIKIVHLRKESKELSVPVPIGMGYEDKMEMIVEGFFQTMRQLDKQFDGQLDETT